MRRTSHLAAAAALAVCAITAALSPAHAIDSGELDEGGHPMVGLMVAQTEDGEPLWRCSGTLIEPTVFVTAGHCTSNDEGGSVEHVELWFGDGPYTADPEFLADIAEGDDLACVHDVTGERHEGYPCTGDVTGEAYTHPSYDPAQFWLWDLGVVRLDERVVLDEYAELPEVGAYDGWTSDRKQRFTAVGFGMQKDHGDGATWKDLDVVQRMVAQPELISINSPYVGDYNMKLTNNSSTGGTCSGDSGGPNFLDGTLEIAAVTSFGMNAQTCGGIGGVYRLDREEDRDWLLCVADAKREKAARACTL